MAKALGLFCGGITELREAAIRVDGAVFTRLQYRDLRYGYRWSPWRATGEVLGENARQGVTEIAAGFATLRRITESDTRWKRVRLPG